jgi:hypothetical protein
VDVSEGWGNRQTVFRFPNNRAYSSKTSCSSGVRLSSPSSDNVDARRFCSGEVAMASSSFIECPFFFECVRVCVYVGAGSWERVVVGTAAGLCVFADARL